MKNKKYYEDKVKVFVDTIKNEILNNIDPSKKTVAFVSYLLNCRNQVGDLHKQFIKKGFNVINIVNQRINDRFEKQAPTFLIPKLIETSFGKIPLYVDFDFIDLIITPDREHITLEPYNEKFLSKRAKRIYLTHDILNGNAFDFFDYVFMPSISGIKNHINKNYRKGFCLIPGGYPKLDYSLKKYNQYKKYNFLQEDSIIYAPTLRVAENIFNNIDANFLVGFDCNVIETLLKNFDEKIIYRPHPNDTNFKNYNTLILYEKFKNEPNIIFNYNNKYLDKYLRSKFLITDISDTAYTYSFTTLKPTISLIYYNYKWKSSIGGFNREYRKYIGFIVKSLKELINYGKKILNEEVEIKEKILRLREKYIFNIGKSGEYLINNIDYILENKKHPDWIYF